MEEKIIKLTNIAYKILDYFPESDPIKNRAKDKVLAIMEDLIAIDRGLNLSECKILENIDVLLGYFEVGRLQGWISSSNFLIITNEYKKIKELNKSSVENFDGSATISPEASLSRKIEISNHHSSRNAQTKSSEVLIAPYSFNARQKKIIEFINKNKKAQVSDLQTVLNNVTKRTIRRDLDDLLKKGKVSRFGEFSQVFYRLKI